MECFYKELDIWLPRAYYVSQILLLFIALFAAIYTRRQLNNAKINDLLKYLEAPESRAARRIVVREIGPICNTRWWEGEGGERLDEAAANVAAVYDVLKLMLENESSHIQRMFYANWADTIIRSHRILCPFLEERRKNAPGAYQKFSELAEIVKRYETRPALVAQRDK